MKKCKECGQYKTEDEFFVRHKNKDGSESLQSTCKECHSKNEMERYYKKQRFIDSKKVPCIKCGEKRTRCITFHHTDPKEKDFTIGKIRKSNLATIEREINKCVCLCLNCHHEFHYLNNSTGLTLEEYVKS